MLSIWHSNDIAGGIKTRVKKGVNSAKILLTGQKLTLFLSEWRYNLKKWSGFSDSMPCVRS